MIVVKAEPRRKLLRVAINSFLTMADIHQFDRDKQAAVAAMGLGTGEFLMLVESSSRQVQTQEVVAAFQELARSSPVRARKLAIVKDGALPRLQSRRIAGARSSAEVFDDLAAAERWLFAD